uniref:Uncharacterized protein n=1 Tax=Anguilla anguilla TaxID=7936 RepID=A0A0E9XEY3_ANGAN
MYGTTSSSLVSGVVYLWCKKAFADPPPCPEMHFKTKASGTGYNAHSSVMLSCPAACNQWVSLTLSLF